ncbi:hypothetical protein XENORESO_002674 [Xenotaenia resolanae]|uniref:Uncharacterized protein n=1 Tax=Xenotaenia resolanae TaxID=208358 RepID=A0ABV0X3D2_9TELE
MNRTIKLLDPYCNVTLYLFVLLVLTNAFPTPLKCTAFSKLNWMNNGFSFSLFGELLSLSELESRMTEVEVVVNRKLNSEGFRSSVAAHVGAELLFRLLSERKSNRRQYVHSYIYASLQ